MNERTSSTSIMILLTLLVILTLLISLALETPRATPSSPQPRSCVSSLTEETDGTETLTSRVTRCRLSTHPRTPASPQSHKDVARWT